MTLPRTALVIVLMASLVACARTDRDITLTRLTKPNDGPDEFLVVPGKPLREPPSYSTLPDPAPGQGNLADLNPRADTIAALGGTAAPAQSQGLPAVDGGLVRHTTRYGPDPDIRQTLAVEDAQVRRTYGRRNILRIGPRDDYTEAYSAQWLDAHLEAQRLRQAGVETPTAPPLPD